MDQSRRAVEAYWRSRMVDAVTSDEDKVAPVYKLEEICELLRTSHPGIVKEVSDYVLKRLDHKSPIVKQKALRLIKYAVGKSGAEFRREMQRHSVAMRQLFHYKGQPDPLKGDALNKAVRDTAHEAIAALFAPDDLKAAVPTEGINKRIEGFGNTNYSATTEDKKSFLSEVVGFGSASIKQGLSTIAAAHSARKDDNGNFSSYKSPTLRRSLTTEIDNRDGYQGYERPRESWSSSGISKDTNSGTWSQDSRAGMPSTTTYEDAGSSTTGVKTREEKLLETVVTSGGVRLQPTRDALQTFLTEALKLDAVAMSYALETKLQSPLWQVRMKAICVLESILRKKDEEHFSIIASFFSERRDSIVKCSELPQVSLREKATKVLSLLEGDQTSGAGLQAGARAPSDAESTPTAIQVPDLIDTGDSVEYSGEASAQQVDQNMENLKPPVSLVDDLFGNDPIADTSTNNSKSEDPFADVSFHVSEERDNDIFAGLSVDNKRSEHELNVAGSSNPDLLDVFSANSEQLQQGTETSKKDVSDLISGLSLNGITQENKQNGASGVAFLNNTFSVGSSQQSQLPASGALNDTLGVNALFTLGPMQQHMPQNIMFNQVYATQPVNYAAMGNLIAQQQLLFQNFGNLNTGIGLPTANAMNGNFSSPIPDIFQVSNNPTQSHGTTMSGSKKEETKAFDFISDHLSAARGSKRVL